MPRIRQIKPDAFRSLTLCRVPIEARWLFAGLLTEADDEGRMKDHAGLIRAALFPLDDLDPARVEDWLDDLAVEECICRYEADGGHFLHMPKWSEHQYVNRPTKSKLPACPKHQPTLAAVRVISPETAQAVASPVVGNPRRCPDHQTGRAVACGACREARVSHEEALKSKPTQSTQTTMCGEHPEHRALSCPVCAAQAVPAPAEIRGRRKRTP